MFSQEQLDAIKFAAKKTKNQGELAVHRYIGNQYQDEYSERERSGREQLFSRKQLTIIKYCAEECKRQRSGEMSVYDMVNAWNYTIEVFDNAPQNMSPMFIEEIGKLVEPIDNKKGFRTIPIGIDDKDGTWKAKAQYAEIPRLLEHLLNAYYSGALVPDEFLYGDSKTRSIAKTAEDIFYYEYENIHPFVDGNGRSGKILYNYLCGTLGNPIMPPNFWGSNNP